MSDEALAVEFIGGPLDGVHQFIGRAVQQINIPTADVFSWTFSNEVYIINHDDGVAVHEPLTQRRGYNRTAM